MCESSFLTKLFKDTILHVFSLNLIKFVAQTLTTTTISGGVGTSASNPTESDFLHVCFNLQLFKCL
jgi:hypothetical protein